MAPRAAFLFDYHREAEHQRPTRRMHERGKLELLVIRTNGDLRIHAFVRERSAFAVPCECVGGPLAGWREIELLIDVRALLAQEQLAPAVSPELPAAPL